MISYLESERIKKLLGLPDNALVVAVDKNKRGMTVINYGYYKGEILHLVTETIKPRSDIDPKTIETDEIENHVWGAPWDSDFINSESFGIVLDRKTQ